MYNWKLLRSKRKTNWQYYWDRHMCRPGCRGLCPCPDPPWEWKQTEKVREADPQQIFLMDHEGNYIGMFHPDK